MIALVSSCDCAFGVVSFLAVEEVLEGASAEFCALSAARFKVGGAEVFCGAAGPDLLQPTMVASPKLQSRSHGKYAGVRFASIELPPKMLIGACRSISKLDQCTNCM